MRRLSLLAAALVAFSVSAAAQTVLSNGETVVRENRTTGAKLVIVVRNDLVSSVVRVERNGTRTQLSALPNPTAGKPFQCLANQKLACYEDNVNQMSVCVCSGGGGGGGLGGGKATYQDLN